MNKKILKHILIDEDKWEFLAPMLERYVVSEDAINHDKSLIDYNEIMNLRQGSRIANILNDGRWDFGTSGRIATVEELKRVNVREFMRHRNAGKISWEALCEYIEKL